MREAEKSGVIRTALLLVLICVAIETAKAQGQIDNDNDVDRYSIKLVRSLLEQPEGFSISWLEKRQSRLGDSAAIALVKIFSEQQLLEPRTLLRSLRIVRGAFSAPCFIEIPADRDPSITLFVLRDLVRQTQEENTKQKILEAITFVQQSSSNPCHDNGSGKPAGSNTGSPRN